MPRLPLLLVCTALCVAAAPAQTLTRIEDGPSSSFEEGWCLAAAGDIDGDGRNDTLVGCPDGVFGSGAVRVLSSTAGHAIWTLSGTPTSRFGAALDGGFDVDFDGTPDFMVGAPEHDEGTIFDNRGRTWVYSGATGMPIHVITGSSPAELVGSAVALLGDLNGDNHSEFAVGAVSGAGNKGQVVIYDGATATVMHTIDGEAVGHGFGTCLARIDDVTNDGVADVLVGAPFAGSLQEGRLYCVSGAAGTIEWTITGSQTAGHLGWSVAGLEDVNADNVPDLVVGCPDYNTALPDDGRAIVCSGVNGAEIWHANGPAIYMKAGLDVDGAGDLDGDGIEDVLVGMPYLPP